MILILFCVFWTAGIYAGLILFESNLHLPFYITLPAIAASILLLIRLRSGKRIVLLVLISIALLGGISRIQSYENAVGQDDLETYNGSYAAMQGVIDSDPEVRDSYTLLHISLERIKPDSEWIETNGKILVYPEKYPALGINRDFPYYNYDDRIEISATLEEPPVLEDFNYKEYLERQRIYSIAYYPNVQLIESGQGNAILRGIYTLRTDMSGAINSSLHEPQASMAQAILLGKRGTIPDSLKDGLAISGTMHLIAISGIHITIMAGLFMALGAWFFGRHRPAYLLLPLIIIWLYTMISGMHPSAIRAAIMSSVYLLAIWSGRSNRSLNALALTAAIMVALQPYVLWDVGFRLSFLAMLGIVLLSPYFEAAGQSSIRRLSGKQSYEPLSNIGNFINKSVAITLGATLATMPAVAFYFNRVSLVSLPATFLALPVLPLVIVTSALVGILGIFALPVARVIGWAAWVALTYLIKIIEFFSSLSFSSIEMDSVAAAPVIAFYVIAGFVLIILGNRKRIFRLVRRAP
ncbi:MAG: ComEC family competence protein [Chloroflexi bacterium]|nr:ComEC family competence protein [Chloroflexota bacterium]MBT7080678.1 ComEC family competence protein [Chloroflexota bacterium]MBT7289595.1 ComEC family competence protein [Chloroflexota bacterium]